MSAILSNQNLTNEMKLVCYLRVYRIPKNPQADAGASRHLNYFKVYLIPKKPRIP